MRLTANHMAMVTSRRGPEGGALAGTLPWFEALGGILFGIVLAGVVSGTQMFENGPAKVAEKPPLAPAPRDLNLDADPSAPMADNETRDASPPDRDSKTEGAHSDVVPSIPVVDPKLRRAPAP